MRRFPASVHTDNIQQKLVGSLVLLKASQCLAWQRMFWVPNRRSHNALQEQQQGEHWPEKFPWQLTVWERGFQGLGYRSARHHDRKWKDKKRRVTLWHNQVCYFWFQSHECWFFFFSLFDTIFSSVLSRALCTFDRVKTHADTHWCVRSSAGLSANSQ